MNSRLTQLLDTVRTGSGLWAQAVRYLFVGGAAYAVDFGLLVGLTETTRLTALQAAPVGFLAGLVLNYCLSISWVFNERRIDDWRQEFTIFTAIGVAGLLINQGVIWLIIGPLGISYIAAKIAAAFVVLCWNFFARRQLLFQRAAKASVATGTPPRSTQDHELGSGHGQVAVDHKPLHDGA